MFIKRIKLLIAIFVLGATITVVGQQDPQYTQYMYNMSIINPAYTGTKGVASIGVLGRSQWVGLEGAPRTATFFINSPVSEAVGLGMSITYDEIDPVKETNISGDFSYTLNVGYESRLALGVKAGVSFLDVGYLKTNEPDPLNEPIHQTSPNFGAGVYYYNENFYLGFSVPNFLETRHLERGGGVVSTAAQKPHYFLTAGYVFEISDNLKLKPSTLVKATSGAPISIDLSVNSLINEVFEVGVSYRLDDSVSGMVGFQVSPDFRIGYAYDYTTSNFSDYNSGSHEIILIFEFNEDNVKCSRCF